MTELARVPVRVSGIPALALVTHFHKQSGSFSHSAPSDLDYYGYTESEYILADQRGRPAPWLERKATENDRQEIDVAINEYMGEA